MTKNETLSDTDKYEVTKRVTELSVSILDFLVDRKASVALGGTALTMLTVQLSKQMKKSKQDLHNIVDVIWDLK